MGLRCESEGGPGNCHYSFVRIPFMLSRNVMKRISSRLTRCHLPWSFPTSRLFNHSRGREFKIHNSFKFTIVSNHFWAQHGSTLFCVPYVPWIQASLGWLSFAMAPKWIWIWNDMDPQFWKESKHGQCVLFTIRFWGTRTIDGINTFGIHGVSRIRFKNIFWTPSTTFWISPSSASFVHLVHHNPH